MEYGVFFEEIGQPFTGRKKEKLIAFLNRAALDYDEAAGYTVNLVTRDGGIAATGSLDGNILKYIAVAPAFQGEGLTARVVTLLMNEAVRAGHTHLFLFTKPKNLAMFAGLGFYPIIQTADILLMENRQDGIGQYVRSLDRGTGAGPVGAIVANCNPFTLGHRCLIEAAAAQCGTLHLFILSEDRSLFPAEARFRLAEAGVRDIPNVVLHRTSDYLISRAVFPTYFMKDKAHAQEANCALDVRIFAEYFARELGITRRFVGTEPNCPVTRAYNETMKQLLPQYGVALVELPRMELDGAAVSASRVRAAMASGDTGALRRLVPEATLEFIRSPQGQKLSEKLRTEQGAL